MVVCGGPYSDLVVRAEGVKKVFKILLDVPWFAPVYVGHGAGMRQV